MFLVLLLLKTKVLELISISVLGLKGGSLEKKNKSKSYLLTFNVKEMEKNANKRLFFKEEDANH